MDIECLFSAGTPFPLTYVVLSLFETGWPGISIKFSVFNFNPAGRTAAVDCCQVSTLSFSESYLYSYNSSISECALELVGVDKTSPTELKARTSLFRLASTIINVFAGVYV